MDALRKKIKEITSAFAESFRAIVWGQFFNTSLQTQLSILQILRNLFLRVGAIDNRVRNEEYRHQRVVEIMENYLKSVDKRVENICLLETKAIDHLQVLLRCARADQDAVQASAENANIWEDRLIEFLLPWFEDKTMIHVGEHPENFGESMLQIGFQRVLAFELNSEGALPPSAGLLKLNGGEHDIRIIQKLPKDSDYQVVMYGAQNKSSFEISQQEEIARYLRGLNYPFSISVVNSQNGRWQFIANMPPRIPDVSGSTLCFRDSVLFEKAYAFMSSQLPVKSIFR